ncbi:MAG: nucleotidyltransferase family protein [Prevotella sp.]|jgi:D-glycero-alpha-D-manno-heptose 1-phosphate guanylyltransferase|nr:nucleotidyltransferase family protein [Prevotella sp.]
MKECIILAGGFGTRLQSVVSDVPKCMAEVAGKPFLQYLFDYAANEKFDHLILSLGYKSDIVINWLERQTRPFEISYVVEEYPLGTGGAIKLAFEKVKGEEAFVINGDTFFDIDSGLFLDFHQSHGADLSGALKPMADFDRYGSVELDDSERIVCFNEKQYKKEGLINGGVYIVTKNLFTRLSLPEKFSFEKDIMELHIGDLNIYGCPQDNYFIDIGIPSDFEKANVDFSKK